MIANKLLLPAAGWGVARRLDPVWSKPGLIHGIYVHFWEGVSRLRRVSELQKPTVREGVRGSGASLRVEPACQMPDRSMNASADGYQRAR